MNNKKISRFLSLVLRHRPEELDLNMDREGWVSIKELLSKMKARDMELSMSELNEIVETNNKKRFKINDKGTHIRASQGHSIEVDLKLKPQTPPDILYHGTATRNLKSIFLNGLIKCSRNHVHLSSDKDTAMTVGRRHSNIKPTVLEIDTVRMQKNGHEFFISDNNVWLTNHIPPKYIKIGVYYENN